MKNMQDEQTLRKLAQSARDRAVAARQTLSQDTQRAQTDIEFDMNNAASAADPRVQQDWRSAAETKRSELAREQMKTQQIIDAADKEAQDYDRQAEAAHAQSSKKEKRRAVLRAADIVTRLGNDNF